MMLELKNISKSYHQTKVLENVQMIVNEHDWVMLTGKSGSGKTTLLNIMTGFIDEYDGEILYEGKKVAENDFARLRRTDFSIVFQEKNFIPEYTVYQNMLVAGALSENKEAEIDELLLHFHLEDLKYRKINELSGGQLQKIAILRALLKKPRMLFLDEPTGNLDTDSSMEVMEMLKILNKEITIIMITHNRELFDYASRVVFIENHQLIEKKTVHEDNNICITVKDIRPLSFGLLMKMGLWNFKYYIKTYCLGILIFVLACSGFVFSSHIGQSVDQDLKDIMLSQSREYELQIFSEDTVAKEVVQDYAKLTHAKDYDLQLKIFSHQNFLINEEEKIPVQLRSTYELENHQKDIVLTSYVFDRIKSNKKFELDMDVLSDFDSVLTNYWVDENYQFYKPVYQKDKIIIQGYEVIESNDSIIYLSNEIIEKIADKNQSYNSNYSNQSISRFKLKYANYQEVINAKEIIEKGGEFETFSVYDDFLSIQKEMENQFKIFSYSSYIMITLVILILCIIIFMVDQNKSLQYKILNELGLTKNEQYCIQIIETGLFFIISLILSVIIISLGISMFNAIFDIKSFLPTSLLELAHIYQLSIDSIKWFNLNVLDILKSLLIIITPTYIVIIFASIMNKRKQQ